MMIDRQHNFIVGQSADGGYTVWKMKDIAMAGSLTALKDSRGSANF